ncbi:hypothetical protein [Burkholderia sp. S171]|uniref:hypothetical protein n=1 Tax=Burkholderia sp. S171 TaxID=1641860 RepID=UPI00349EEB3E
MRSPWDPVSTWILLIVWHVLVPGTQIVTLVCSMFLVPVAICATVMGSTLGVVDWATVLAGALAGWAGAAAAGALAADAPLDVSGALAAVGELAPGAAALVESLLPPPPPQPDIMALAATIAVISTQVRFRMVTPIQCLRPRRRPATRWGATPGR